MKRYLSADPVIFSSKNLFIILVLSFTACSSASHSRISEEDVIENRADHHGQQDHSAHQNEVQADYSELEALYWARLEASRSSFTQADVDFMTDMIAHHAQALIMSRLAPQNGASRQVQALAARIHSAQEDEIATMQKWLRDRNQPVPEVHIDGLILMIHMAEPASNDSHTHVDHMHGGDNDDVHNQHQHHDGHGEHEEDDPEQMLMAHHHHHDMPGMLTQDQLEELAEARDNEFDQKFLTFMIEHHLGAVFMVDQLFESDGAGNDNEIFDLASDIHAEQVTEINRMRLMLDQMEADQH